MFVQFMYPVRLLDYQLSRYSLIRKQEYRF